MKRVLFDQSGAPLQVFHLFPLFRVFESHVVSHRVWVRESSGTHVHGADRAVSWIMHVNVLPNIDQRWQHGLAQRTVVCWQCSSDLVICNATTQCAALPSIIHTIFCLIVTQLHTEISLVSYCIGMCVLHAVPLHQRTQMDAPHALYNAEAERFIF